MNVDGGVINNEPFEIARRELAGGPGRRNPRDPKNADRAVVMIDPFPNVVDFTKDYDPVKEGALFNVIKRLVTVVIQNARFKPEELALAEGANGKIYSRFLIAPASRIGTGENREEDRKALLSGSLGAFGGFLSQKFRERDYILGRRNCQQFLRKHFVLHSDNKVFEGWSDDMKSRMAIRDEHGKAYLPIIPLLPLPELGDPNKPNEGLRRKIDLPDRPRLSEAALEAIYGDSRTRVDRIVKRLIGDAGLNIVWRGAVRLAWSFFGRTWVMNRIKGWMEDSLGQWDLLENPRAPVSEPAMDPQDRGH
jgi:hypothetical protein